MCPESWRGVSCFLPSVIFPSPSWPFFFSFFLFVIQILHAQSKLCYTLHWMPGIYITPVTCYCPGDLQGLWQVGPGVSVLPSSGLIITTIARVAGVQGTYNAVVSLLNCICHRRCAWSGWRSLCMWSCVVYTLCWQVASVTSSSFFLLHIWVGVAVGCRLGRWIRRGGCPLLSGCSCPGDMSVCQINLFCVGGWRGGHDQTKPLGPYKRIRCLQTVSEVPFWNGIYIVLSKVDVVTALGEASSVVGSPHFDKFRISLAFLVVCSFTLQGLTWV